MDILTTIECHLQHTATPPSTFGRVTCNDPRLVFDLRRGRRLQGPLQAQILDYIASGTKRDHLSGNA